MTDWLRQTPDGAFHGIARVPDGDVELKVSPTGSVLLRAGNAALGFRTLAHYDAVMELLDRQRAAIGCQQTFDQWDPSPRVRA